jgi:hypothetical protein
MREARAKRRLACGFLPRAKSTVADFATLNPNTGKPVFGAGEVSARSADGGGVGVAWRGRP